MRPHSRSLLSAPPHTAAALPIALHVIVLTVRGLSRAFAVLWSVGDASSGGDGSSPLALGMCTQVCVLCVPSDAARASGPVGENRVKFR